MPKGQNARVGGAVYWKNNRRILFLTAGILTAFFSIPNAAKAQALLRDAEIEHAIYEISEPIFKTAGIPPKDIKILLVNNDSINAFVAGGLNIFIHSGLIKATTNAGMFMSVIAHETGHIAGAHLSKLRGISKRATIGSIIGAVLGAAAIAGGGSDAGIGVLAGSQSMAQRRFLADIRINEQSADHAALKYLDTLRISASDMRDMFKILRRNERGRRQDPYLVSHPLSKERVATVREHVLKSNIPPGQVPERFNILHARMRAKLIGFTQSLESIASLYPESDTSFAARYARAIGYYRHNQLERGLKILQELLAEKPNDAFLYDTKGQILFEYARPKEAEIAYARANALFPNSALIQTEYARSLLAQNTQAKIIQAIGLLQNATTLDKSHAFAWRQLATAYGKMGKLGESYLSLAQESAARGNYKEAQAQLKRAEPLLADNAHARQAAQDLAQEATQVLKRRDETDSLF
jgi:predicted Zn-dependent protease